MTQARKQGHENQAGLGVGWTAGLVLIGWVVGSVVFAGPAQAQETHALFDAARVEVGDQDRMTHSIDIDGDGYLDAIGYWWYEEDDTELDRYRIAAYRFDPATGYTRVWELFEGEVGAVAPNVDRLPMDVGDVYGSPGFTVATREDGVRTYQFSGTNAIFIGAAANPTGVTDIRRADFNGDGVEDIAALAGDELRIWFALGLHENPRVGSFTVTPRDYLTVAELDGDGDPDLILWDETTFDLYTIENEIATFAGSFPTLSDDGRVAAGDIDGDGDEDIVTFLVPRNLEDPQFQVFRRTGPSSFDPEAIAIGGPAETLVDVDLDGDLDGLCCGGGGGGGGGNPPAPRFNKKGSTFFVSLNDGAGNFATAYRIPGLGAIQLAGAADIDLDGDIDLVGGRAVYYGHENAFVEPPYVTGNYLVTPTGLADVDDDGDLDFKFGLQDTQHFVNDATGRMSETTTVYPPAPPGTVFRDFGYAGDFTGDGAVDLIVTHTETNGTFLGMRLLANTGGGGLVDAGYAGDPREAFVWLEGGASSIWVQFHALDVDGDGDQDFCAFVPNNQFVGRAWINDGTGHFEPGATFDGFAWYAGDLNGDGITDLLTQTRLTPRVYFVPGLGGGAFGPAVQIGNFGAGSYPDAGDIDDNGTIDVVTISDFGGIRFHINDGAGQFSLYMTLPDEVATGGALPRAFIADVDGDGRSDIVANNAEDEDFTSTVWLYTGPGITHGAPRKYVMRPMALADFDGDGDLDAANYPFFAGRKTIVRNRTFEGMSVGACRQFGVGLAGSGGHVPVLGTTGPLRPGHPIEHRLRNGLGSARAILVWGTDPVELPKKGGTLYTNPLGKERLRLSGAAGVPGVGSYTFSYPDVRASWVGRSFILQFGVIDPAASQGVAISNAEEVVYGL